MNETRVAGLWEVADYILLSEARSGQEVGDGN